VNPVAEIAQAHPHDLRPVYAKNDFVSFDPKFGLVQHKRWSYNIIGIASNRVI
jgi:hypothetical protein